MSKPFFVIEQALIVVCILVSTAQTAFTLTSDLQMGVPVYGPELVVEDVKPGSTLHNADLRPGDIILSWRELEPHAQPSESGKTFQSMFSWQLVEEEVAPAKAIELKVKRGAELVHLVVQAGRLEASIRPHWTSESLKLYSQAREKLALHDVEAASSSWEQLTRSLSESGYDDLACWLTVRSAKELRKERQLKRAVQVLGNALQSFSDVSCQIELHEGLGLSFQRDLKPEDAERNFAISLALKERLRGKKLSWATTRVLLGVLAWEQRRLDVAQEHWNAALEIQKQLAPKSFLVITTLANLGSLAAFRTDFGKAEIYTREALRLAEQEFPDNTLVAGTINTLANIQSAQGNLDEAYSNFHRALGILKQEPDSDKDSSKRLTMARITNNIGAIAYARGDLEGAARSYRMAFEIWEELLPSSLESAMGLSNLGNTFLYRGELELARDYYMRALDIRRKLAPKSLDTAASLNNLGVVADFQGNSDSSERYHAEALGIQEEIAPLSLNTARSLLNLGARARDRGNLEHAKSLYERALKIFYEQSAYSEDVASGLADLGGLSRLLGQRKIAKEYLERSLGLIEKIAPESELAARIYFGMAQVLAPDDVHRATASLEEAASRLDRLMSGRAYLQSYTELFSRQHERVYKMYIDILIDSKNYTSAFNVLERYRARKFLSLLSQRDLLSTEIPAHLRSKQARLSREYDLLQDQLASLERSSETALGEEILMRMRDLRFQRASLTEEIKSASPRLTQLRHPKPLDLKSAQDTLDQTTVLLSYSLAERNSYLFVLSKGQFHVERLATNSSELQEKVRHLRALIAAAGVNGAASKVRKEALISAGRELYDLLVRPAERYIEPGERLLIVPDGILHILPWGSLTRAGEARRDSFLAEWKFIHISQSATVYAQTIQTRLTQARRGELVIFGDPIPLLSPELLHDDENLAAVTRKGFTFSPLPGSRSEVERIAAIFPNSSRALLGAEASEENVKALPQSTPMVHFATHAALDEVAPLDSAVVLSIPEKFVAGRDNGLLQAWEIFEEIRINADLVVLSACESGLGKEMGGEGLIGLTRAFQYAGARSVMASLWKISDRTTAEFMVRFYSHLKEGLSKDEALRTTQIEFIRGPIQVTNEKGERVEFDASAPYYWAAFQIYGDWQ